MPTMRAVQVSKAKAPFELVERPIPEPKRGQVRIKVQACGVCHSDSIVKEGFWPVPYPRVPGHEVVGVIDALGPEVAPEWKQGQRVGVGWYGGHCGHCEPCRRGNFMLCRNGLIAGIHFDGGYQDYMIAPFQAIAAVPDALSAVDAAPLMCAGITTFNALRHSGAQPGDTVAILGVGGLGHLGVQYAAHMGFHTVAIARGKEKEKFVKQLGAHNYIDSQAGDVAQALQKFGGADVILATVTAAKAMSDVIPGLAPDGRLIIVGAPGEPLQVSALDLIGARRQIRGWPSGSSIDSEDTLNFSEMSGIKPMTEVYPLEKAAEAYDRMSSGNARFRVVITTGN